VRHFSTTLCLSFELKGAHIAAMRVIEALDPPCEYITGALLLCGYLCRCCRCTARSIHPRGCDNKPTLLVRLTTTHNPNLHPFASSGARAGEDTAASPRCCCRCADANCGRGATVPAPLSCELTLASRVCASRSRRLWWKGGGQARRRDAPSLEAEGVASCSRAVCKALSSSTCKI
jgi:hypothetical protein